MSEKKKAGRKNLSRQAIRLWIEEDSTVLDKLSGESVSFIFESEFAHWMDVNNVKMSYATFNNNFKLVLKDMGLENKIVNTGKLSNHRAKTLNLNYREKFKMIKTYAHMIGKGYIKSLIIYGTPGSGKDYAVEHILGKSAQYYGGSVKGVYDLVSILYKHRKDEVIVFSDMDSVMKTLEMKNILKNALEDQDLRYIDYHDDRKQGKRNSIPSRFEFTSRVIVVSNMRRFDHALKSRSVSIEIDMNKYEMFDWIEFNLEQFMPKVPMEKKTAVLDYIKRHMESIATLDFRKFKQAVATYLANQEIDDSINWKEWILMLLNS